MLKRDLLIKTGVLKPKKIKNAIDLSKRSKKSTKISKIQQKDAKISLIKQTQSQFDEEIQELETKFRIKAKSTKKAVEGIITLTSTNPKLQKKLFDEQFPLFLQVNSIKVPKIHSRIVRIPLKHSFLTPESEVCLIVSDVKGIPNKNHEDHLEHYEKLLSQKGVNNIKKVITFHEFRTEYETYELKNRLVELYDAFLVDGKISGKTVKKCGKIFYKKRKIPTAVKLQATKLKEHIDQALKKTPLYLHGKGDSFMVQIGHSNMTEKEIVENIFYVLKGLDKEFPGGFDNIRSLNLFTFRGITIPIYISLKIKNQVATPTVTRKPYVVNTVSGEITTKVNTGVIVKPTGEIKVFQLKDEDDGQNQPPEKKESKNVHKTNNKKRKLEKQQEQVNLVESAKKKKKIKENYSRDNVKKVSKKKKVDK